MEIESDFGDPEDQRQRIARLAALQRLREQAATNGRHRMLQTLDSMIQAEMRALLESAPREPKSRA